MITLTFQKTHLSITRFPSIEIPSFTLITGANGAGKTHLLQSIHNGSVQTNITPGQSPHNQGQVRIFDWTNMVPQDGGYFSSENILNERLGLYQNLSNQRNANNFLEVIRNVVRQFNFGEQYLAEPTKAAALTEADVRRLIPDSDIAATAFTQLSQAVSNAEAHMLRVLDPNSQVQLQTVASRLKKTVISLDEKDVLSPALPSWGQIDLFQQSFARLFVAYRDLQLANSLAELQASKGDPTSFLTEADFIKMHGAPPWDFVNQSLRGAGLDFEINRPEPLRYSQFQPVLTKKNTGASIPFSALSSGEKVLMSFAFCVYYSNDRRQLAMHPKLILLDEIDAPLHPSMSRNIIETITNTLVKDFGINVIATTHSPSTVALAPDDCIYVMRADEPGLHLSSKAEALNILTVGVPTLAISYDGRRQVFVESPLDAKIYDAIYKVAKSRLKSERSLEFIATGSRTKTGDQNTGCGVVRRLVSDLCAAGNRSVFGLLDWDGKNEPENRVFVLAHQKRNGLENLVLDPLLVGLTICREFPQKITTYGFSEELTYLTITLSDCSKFQNLVDAMGNAIFGNLSSKTAVEYAGGLSLRIDTRFLTTDDHKLEAQIMAAFPFLAGISKNQTGRLLEHVVTKVVAECPHLMPKEFIEILEALLESPAHE